MLVAVLQVASKFPTPVVVYSLRVVNRVVFRVLRRLAVIGPVFVPGLRGFQSGRHAGVVVLVMSGRPGMMRCRLVHRGSFMGGGGLVPRWLVGSGFLVSGGFMAAALVVIRGWLVRRGLLGRVLGFRRARREDPGQYAQGDQDRQETVRLGHDTAPFLTEAGG
jgi:hypothetical protein